jgi:CheY-like chemotaxis protein
LAERRSGIHTMKDFISILLVDDNPHNQLLAKTYLERNGCSVSIVDHGELALTELGKNKYDLIIMDVQMPILDGIETTKQIREKLKIDTPIIGCSAHALSSERKKCISAGMNGYITKPYSEIEIVDAVWGMIQNRAQSTLKTEAADSSTEQILEIFKEWEFSYGRETMVKLVTILRELIPETIEAITTNKSEIDFTKVASASHKICGSLGSLNLNQGYELAQQLERVAKNKDELEVSVLSSKLIDYLYNLMKTTASIS